MFARGLRLSAGAPSDSGMRVCNRPVGKRIGAARAGVLYQSVDAGSPAVQPFEQLFEQLSVSVQPPFGDLAVSAVENFRRKVPHPVKPGLKRVKAPDAFVHELTAVKTGERGLLE